MNITFHFTLLHILFVLIISLIKRKSKWKASFGFFLHLSSPFHNNSECKKSELFSKSELLELRNADDSLKKKRRLDFNWLLQLFEDKTCLYWLKNKNVLSQISWYLTFSPNFSKRQDQQLTWTMNIWIAETCYNL